jgi:hypothetical protein
VTAQTVQRLREIARSDATVAPLARLQARALEAAAAGAWDRAAPGLSPSGSPMVCHSSTMRR